MMGIDNECRRGRRARQRPAAGGVEWLGRDAVGGRHASTPAAADPRPRWTRWAPTPRPTAARSLSHLVRLDDRRRRRRRRGNAAAGRERAGRRPVHPRPTDDHLYAVPIEIPRAAARSINVHGRVVCPGSGSRATTRPARPAPWCSRAAPTSPAMVAGLQPATSIVSIDGQPIDSMAMLALSLRDYDAGAMVDLAYVRDGQRATSSAVLTERPSAPDLVRCRGACHRLRAPPHQPAGRKPGPTASAATPTPAPPSASSCLRFGLSIVHQLASVPGDVGLLVGVARAPSRPPSGGRWPRATGTRCTAAARAGSARAGTATGRAASGRATRAGRRARGATPLSSRTTSPGDPAVGRHVAGPVEALPGAPRPRPTARSSRWTNWRGGSSSSVRMPVAAASERASQARPVGRRAAVHGPQHGAAARRARRPPTSPARSSAWARCDGVGQLGVRAQRGVLGEGHRVVGPRAVDQGRRQHHDVADAGGGGRVEERRGAVDGGPRRRRLRRRSSSAKARCTSDIGAVEQRGERRRPHVERGGARPWRRTTGTVVTSMATTRVDLGRRRQQRPAPAARPARPHR